jgi:hypothetical protein
MRRTTEDKLAAQLSRHGVRAVPAYALLSDADQKDREHMMSMLREKGFDGLVEVKLVDAHQQLVVYPGFGYYDGYWAGAWGNYWGGTDVTAVTIVRVEVNAYSLANNQLIWSAMSKSTDPDSTNDLVNAVSKVMGERLAQDRIIGAPTQIARR